ncbi:phosphoribosylglycinamide formyltransferase [Rhodovulum sp. 12E13]|uniref:phosphoribosylglycinamide formyltransferase n=1 Tax=Rhodovulum sp. 12E13 TaxID=2203891 RepID=UPI000E153B99|nr:phosphoribosylglycinamide formyltransferase [Rhodovulum sp. 12E13]RDC69667.1 phosphoribosylglycinamide formyltransferase [Rhodovulum sp. 12E13]
MRRVAILISGTGSNMVRLVEALKAEDSPGDAVVVVSNEPAAGGLARARALGVPALAVDHRPFGRDRAAFEAALDAALAPFAPDVICLAGFMRILTAGFVSRWGGRLLNVHPSLLPALKGLDTHARALADGHAEHGCTVHLVTPALDDGPILGQARVPVEPGDTPASLAARVQAAEHRLYPAVLLRVLRGEQAPLLMP